MASSLSIKLGNFLFKYCFPIYKVTYKSFKEKQDAFEISLMKKYIKKGDSVLDIGANIGFYAETLSNIVGENGTVHCFEPDKINFEHLKNRSQALKNVVISNKAVSKKTEKLKIYTSKKLNVDHRTYKPDVYDQEIEIDAISIDDYLKANNSINTISFIKMDIQGFEMSAIRGMTECLSNSNLKILSEFWPYGMRKAGTNVLDYYNHLKQLNFNIYLIKENNLIELTEETVKTFLELPESIYMNILASKDRV